MNTWYKDDTAGAVGIHHLRPMFGDSRLVDPTRHRQCAHLRWVPTGECVELRRGGERLEPFKRQFHNGHHWVLSGGRIIATYAVLNAAGEEVGCIEHPDV